MRQSLITAGLCLGLAAFAGAAPTGPATSTAGVPKADLFLGYSLLRSDGASLHGGELSLGWNLSKVLGLVFDFDGHSATVDGIDRSRSGAFVGPRVSFRISGVTPFVHALVGVARSEDSIDAFEGVRISDAHTGLAGAAGGGLDFKIATRWAVRAQGDYRVARIKSGGTTETQKDPRVSLGVVFRIGTR